MQISSECKKEALKYIINTNSQQNKLTLLAPSLLGAQLIGSHGDATCLRGMTEGLDEGSERKDLRLYLSVCSLDKPCCTVTWKRRLLKRDVSQFWGYKHS